MSGDPDDRPSTHEPVGDPISRVVLVGFMASGKSSAGRILARRLGWEFADVDRVIEAAEGRSVARIFSESGEARFREIEAETTKELLRRDRIVIAAGGGWAAVPGRLEGLPDETMSVWLRVSAEETIRRARSRPGERPLLEGEDPLGTARRLIEEREPHYRLATVVLTTDLRSPTEVATELAHRIRGDT